PSNLSSLQNAPSKSAKETEKRSKPAKETEKRSKPAKETEKRSKPGKKTAAPLLEPKSETQTDPTEDVDECDLPKALLDQLNEVQPSSNNTPLPKYLQDLTYERIHDYSMNPTKSKDKDAEKAYKLFVQLLKKQAGDAWTAEEQSMFQWLSEMYQAAYSYYYAKLPALEDKAKCILVAELVIGFIRAEGVAMDDLVAKLVREVKVSALPPSTQKPSATEAKTDGLARRALQAIGKVVCKVV
ncbi:MAG: hypothetical protein KGQ49_05845, partial [Verrucomicrobia bacterium]|nr:hypothetical protein [Verrucomicrobiota bacterium]